ncbi:MAG TPA: MBOAT family O-acyltransferase [Kiloniellaceae bacterium]|nr:MBOAT family O-acyltransferase [Kiloniellaceae bacterium]
MIYSAQFYFFFALTGSVLYWIIPESFYRLRYALILLCSFVLVYSAYPYAALLACAVTVLAWAICQLGERPGMEKYHGPLPFLIFLPLVTLDWADLAGSFDIAPKALFTFGLSYYTLKLFGSIRIAWAASNRSFAAFLSTALFFPAFPAGPIDYHASFSRDVIASPFDARLYLSGILRFGSGVLKLYVISDFFTDLLDDMTVRGDLGQVAWSEMAAGLAYLACLVKFLSLYFNFSGYTDIAIAIGRLFGFRLSENFHFPLLSYNIQNFWQRWHLSLSRFVSRFIFLPMVRRTGRPVMAIFIAFVLVGIWHEFSPNYLIWGIGHGAALAFLMARNDRKKKAPPLVTLRDYGLRGLSIWLTVSYVAILSTFANEPGLDAGGRLLLSLIGL